MSTYETYSSQPGSSELRPPRPRRPLPPRRFDELADGEYLLATWRSMRATAGDAAGVDGLEPKQVLPRDAAQITRSLAQSLHAGTYRPSTTRPVDIPKRSGTGVRTLQIATWTDRLVARALLEHVQPLWEPEFAARSWGFRPGRGVRQALLSLLEDLQRHPEARVLATDDVQNAFDHVPVPFVLEHHRRQQTKCNQVDPQIITLLEQVLSPGPSGNVGVAQGSPLSPWALNVTLHVLHDLQQPVDSLWHRYADNLLYVAPTVEHVQAQLDHSTRQLASQNLTLSKRQVARLDRGESLEYLGYEWAGVQAGEIRKRNDATPHVPQDIRLHIPAHAWLDLRRNLESCYATSNPSASAKQYVHLWINNMALTTEDWESVISRVLASTVDYGFRELRGETVYNWFTRSYQAWVSNRKLELEW